MTNPLDNMINTVKGFFGEQDTLTPTVVPWKPGAHLLQQQENESLQQRLKREHELDLSYNPYWYDYAMLWDTMKYDPQNPEIKVAMRMLMKHADKYKDAAEVCNVPWEIIAVKHLMEGGGNILNQFLNGQKWSLKTTIVPKGCGPFKSFEDSCKFAFEFKKGHLPPRWTIQNTLYYMELWNGMGYRKYHPNVKSPYLWDTTNHYTTGKYGADGKWDPNLQSKQVGAAVLLRELEFAV